MVQVVDVDNTLPDVRSFHFWYEVVNAANIISNTLLIVDVLGDMTARL